MCIYSQFVFIAISIAIVPSLVPQKLDYVIDVVNVNRPITSSTPRQRKTIYSHPKEGSSRVELNSDLTYQSFKHNNGLLRRRFIKREWFGLNYPMPRHPQLNLFETAVPLTVCILNVCVCVSLRGTYTQTNDMKTTQLHSWADEQLLAETKERKVEAKRRGIPRKSGSNG